MATAKKANVPPTHPTVWIGLALAAIGLLVATYAYTGVRVYDIAYAFVALAGALLALAGILVAAWGRSIMAARAARARRATFKEDALALGTPVAVSAEPASEDAPTIAASREKKRFAFSLPRREPKEKPEKAGVFAFKRRAHEASAKTAAAPDPVATDAPAADARDADAASPELDRLLDEVGDLQQPQPVRVTLKCPSCASTFQAEGVRPFDAKCPACGFSAVV